MCPDRRPCSRKEGKGKRYYADDTGSIYGTFGNQRSTHRWKNYRRLPNCHSDYPQVDGILVSRLVCSAFHGAPKRGHQCHHLNGNIFDNRPENLIWLSKARHRLYDNRLKALKQRLEIDISVFNRRDFIRFARMSESSFQSMLATFTHVPGDQQIAREMSQHMES